MMNEEWPGPVCLVTDIPKFDLANVQAAIRDAIHWQTHYPTTREERIARDEALIRLRQADWHVTHAISNRMIAKGL